MFYIGTNQPEVLTEIRRHILANFENPPVAGEYMHRDIYDIAEKIRQSTNFLMIDKLGTDKMPFFFINSRDAPMRCWRKVKFFRPAFYRPCNVKIRLPVPQPFTAAHEKLAR